ncbi:hypothetical protein [Marilutibacter alkalisoli]|uniref:Lipoprotein n=1 Tax=Marilutibacter alkalisoli TaxID=2591633 RepID=A0A514BSH6_9GAMM|nr:hypothetical protein [Lysobacter alkalisoli]QDH70336.1 hypothetical protein FKV23_09710 [Lysobacter alkalisoli]
MKIIPDTTSPSVALAVTIILAVLASGCMGNPEVGIRRVQKNVYLISSDRCAVLGDELERDIRDRATLQCRHGVAEMGEFRSRPSRQGSLLGECLRSGALEAQVTCHGGKNKAE